MTKKINSKCQPSYSKTMGLTFPNNNYIGDIELRFTISVANWK